MNQEDKKQMVEVVGEALEQAVLPAIQELKDDVKILKDDVKVLKDDVKVLKNDVVDLKDSVEDLNDQVGDLNQRMEKVEFNTRVYPHDKEYVDDKLADHEIRIKNLELKKV